MRFLFIILLVLLAIPAEARQASVFSDADSLRVGDIFRFSLVLSHDPDAEYIYPDSTAFGKDFDFLHRRMYRSNGNDSIVYRLQFFGTSDSEIPETRVLVISGSDTSAIYFPSYPVYFQSLLFSEDDELRPMKPIYNFPRSVWFYVFWLILLALLGYLVWLAYKNRPVPEPKKEIPPPMPPPEFVSPLELLAQKLAEIARNYSDPSVDYKSYFSELSDAVRWYMEEVYDILAMESTSREILHDLDLRYTDEALKKTATYLLRMADRVKFAKFSPTPEDALKMSELAHTFLEQAQIADRHAIAVKRRNFEAQFSQQTDQNDDKEEALS